jgi:hypothetical protein
METVQLDALDNGLPVLDKHALRRVPRIGKMAILDRSKA